MKGVNRFLTTPHNNLAKKRMVQRRSSIEEVQVFDRNKLKHVDEPDAQPLPTTADIYGEMLPDNLSDKAELKEIKSFVINKLRHVKTPSLPSLPTQEMIDQEKVLTHSEVKGFDHTNLKPVLMKETCMLPTLNDLRAELMPDFLPTRPELHKLQMFVRSYLKHVETHEKVVLPTMDDIEAEAASTMAEVKQFDKSKLRRSLTVEKNTIPGLATLWSEILPDYMPSRPELAELVKFAQTDLRHVKPNVKCKLPSAKDIHEEAIDTRAEVKKFDHKSLKRANTIDKTTLPTAADMYAELLPDYLPPKPEINALKNFIRATMRHVVTLEKNTLPTVEEILSEKKKS